MNYKKHKINLENFETECDNLFEHDDDYILSKDCTECSLMDMVEIEVHALDNNGNEIGMK